MSCRQLRPSKRSWVLVELVVALALLTAALPFLLPARPIAAAWQAIILPQLAEEALCTSITTILARGWDQRQIGPTRQAAPLLSGHITAAWQNPRAPGIDYRWRVIGEKQGMYGDQAALLLAVEVCFPPKGQRGGRWSRQHLYRESLLLLLPAR